MVGQSRTQQQVDAAMRAVAEAEAGPAEKVEMLMEIAMGLQQKPKAVSDIEAAIGLYRTAVDLCPPDLPLLGARIRARLGTAWMALPCHDPSALEQARDTFEAALETLRSGGQPAEIAEAEMNLGLALQGLVALGHGRIQGAIAAYQRSLRTFDKERYPREFAILQSNLATAFLSIPFTDERSRMREALAVQAFEEGLAVVTLIDHPNEYAMLQNNLGNALQYVSSSHRIENGYRAIEAYDEALKVRTADGTPGEYANTITNKANCLANLPDNPAAAEAGNPENLRRARALYREALQIFRKQGEEDKAASVEAAIAELEADPRLMHSGVMPPGAGPKLDG